MECPESVDCRVSFLTEQNHISLLGLLSLMLISLRVSAVGFCLLCGNCGSFIVQGTIV